MVDFPNREPGLEKRDARPQGPGVRPPGRGSSVINNGGGDGASGLLLLLLDRDPLLPRRQHLVEGVHTHGCPAEGEGPGVRAQESPPRPSLPEDRGARAHWMDLIHSSFSSCVGAEIRYTMWFPSTTRPSASVLQALMSCPLLLGM